MVKTFFQARRVRKNAEEVLRHAKHLRHMREDLMAERDVTGLCALETDLRQTLKRRGETKTIEDSAERLLSRVHDLTPRRGMPGLRENVEVLAVAIAVAMGVRTYFIQPFKIPTGSMQPSLYGITAVDRAAPLGHDRMPVKPVKWFVTGEWYRQVKVARSGYLSPPVQGSPAYPADVFFTVSGRKYRIPRSALSPTGRIRSSGYGPNDYVEKGTVLWAGSRTAGDHVFVDKVRWNFLKAKRGDIMVFGTRGITDLEASLAADKDGEPISTHYIKRMVGMPEETLHIRPPSLIVNGEEVVTPEGIRRVAECDEGYDGYTLAGRVLSSNQPIELGEDEYYALGDNTRNSRDGRYWGAVPSSNLVGPAFAVYWPFYPVTRTPRWGLTK